MTRRGTYDPDVTDEHFGEIVDTEADHRPTRAELAEVDEWPEPIVPKVPIEPCEDCVHVLCALQRALRRRA